MLGGASKSRAVSGAQSGGMNREAGRCEEPATRVTTMALVSLAENGWFALIGLASTCLPASLFDPIRPSNLPGAVAEYQDMRDREQVGGCAGSSWDLSDEIIAACIEVHRHLGPGLLESAYQKCLCHELSPDHGVGSILSGPYAS